MSKLPKSAITGLLLVNLLFCARPTRAQSPTTRPWISKRVTALLARLGDRDPHVRQAAADALLARGMAVVEVLRPVASGPDPEAARQARFILHKLDAGLAPDTPEKVLDYRRQYLGHDSMQILTASTNLSEAGLPGLRVLVGGNRIRPRRHLRGDQHCAALHPARADSRPPPPAAIPL